MTDTTFSDSYIITDAELETLIGYDPRASAVALKALAATAQGWYCQEATRQIDRLPLRGVKYDLDQTLEFPRVIDGVITGDAYESAVVPDLVKRACLEEAIALYTKGTGGGRAQLQEEGVKSFSIGGKLQETFVDGAGNSVLLSSAAKRIMRRYMGAEVR